MSFTPFRKNAGPRLFEEDFQKLGPKLAHPTGYLKELRDLMVQHAVPEPPESKFRQEYVPSAVMLGLLDGSKEAIANARAAFLREWSDGASLGNPVHYWNSQQFKTGDRWISAAMMSLLLVLWDWLAVAGAWSEAEIDEHAETTLGILEVFVESHLKGRGHMPILHDPINQGAAMSTGLLYAGYLFGFKWRQDPRAVRMYGRARNLVPDHIGQFLKSGYDSDGFTYMRHIHPQCFSLALALLEDVEGGDWYHRRFAPNDISLAWINERQFDLMGPSGCSWPFGRYGYMQVWNVFSLAYAAKRTGDPRYLQTSRRDNAKSNYNSPWLRMEIPMALLWYPEALNETITKEPLSIHPVQECLPDFWAAFYDPKARVQTVFHWMQGKVPHFVLETAESPLILGGGNAWSDANGVQPGDFDYDLQGWMTPAGKLIRYGDLPGCSAVAVETTPAYPPKAEVSHAGRAIIDLRNGIVVVSDRFSSSRPQPAFWQARVKKGSTAEGLVATLAGFNGVTGRLASADGTLSVVPSGLKRLEHAALGGIESDFLRITGTPGASAFDVAISWDERRAPAVTRDRGDLITVRDGAETFTILLPASSRRGLRRIGNFETDADLAVLDAAGKLSLFGARLLRDADGERLWSDVPLNVVIESGGLSVEGLGYGNFVTYRETGGFIGVKRGNGLEIYARMTRTQKLRFRGDFFNAVLNDVPVDLEKTGEWNAVTLQPWKKPAIDLISALRAAASKDSDVIIPLLNQVRAAMLREAAPVVREFLKWDGSTIHHPKNPLATEGVHVRMEAARTLACLGDDDSIDPLIELVQKELVTVYDASSKWGAQFWGSNPRIAAIEALLFLHAEKFLPLIDLIKPVESVPHAQDLLIRAKHILSP